MSEDWLGRWAEGRTGWHEPGGNEGLHCYWPEPAQPGSVLVPLCGKSPDLLWLARRGHTVTGVEFAEIAVAGFFDDNELAFERSEEGGLARYAATGLPLTLWCGDYFAFRGGPFDALCDRAALVALPETDRARYVEHTKGMLRPDAPRLIVTLEYDQSVVAGPPYSVTADELAAYWDDLEKVGELDAMDNCPPKFRAAGLTEVREVFWRSRWG